MNTVALEFCGLNRVILEVSVLDCWCLSVFFSIVQVVGGVHRRCL